jgi:hypothetical protein
MLKLYRFERTWGIHNLSHFCCKTETYLRRQALNMRSNQRFSHERAEGQATLH